MSRSSLSNLAAGELRAHIAKHNIRVAELAERMGVRPAWIYRRLNGEVALTLDDAEVLCAALGLQVADIVREEAAAS